MGWNFRFWLKADGSAGVALKMRLPGAGERRAGWVRDSIVRQERQKRRASIVRLAGWLWWQAIWGDGNRHNRSWLRFIRLRCRSTRAHRNATSRIPVRSGRSFGQSTPSHCRAFFMMKVSTHQALAVCQLAAIFAQGVRSVFGRGGSSQKSMRNFARVVGILALTGTG